MESHSEATGADAGTKKSPFEDLNKDELVVKCKALLAIAQKAKQSKTDLQTEVESYKLRLEKCETEKKATTESLHTLQELVDSLTEQKLNYITEVDSAKGKIKALSNKCKDYEDEVERYKTEVLSKDKSLVDATKKMSDLDSEITSLKRQNNRLVEESEQLINQLSELEAQTVEFNNIGLEQRKQLQLLEEKVQSEAESKTLIDKLNTKIKELEDEVKNALDAQVQLQGGNEEYENKIKEITQLYESEKSKKEKANIKLRSYKDKILKCAACINQLKNSRFILTKTIKEYSENIPKWQNDIIKASRVLDDQLKELNNENMNLKNYIEKLETELINLKSNPQITEMTSEISAYKENINNLKQSKVSLNEMLEKKTSELAQLGNEHLKLQAQLTDLQSRLDDVLKNKTLLSVEIHSLKEMYSELLNKILPAKIDENKQISMQLKEEKERYDSLLQKMNELSLTVENLTTENLNLSKSVSSKVNNTEMLENLNLQIRALESEKSILVKEKMNAKDNVIELENRNKLLSDQLEKLKSDLKEYKTQCERLQQEKHNLEKNHKSEKESENNNLKRKIIVLQEQYDLLKKEHDNLQDLNGLLKEEVDTLKLSLEQPRPDDNENSSDLNVSLQADIVKLETKLSAYKQENSSLLAEVKESRAKVKEFDSLTAEYEDAKSKLLGYKTENSELLNEMKEINQVLKERGESISKLQKAIAEMERLVDTLEKDRAVMNQENETLQKRVASLENDLQNAQQNTTKNSEVANQIVIEKENALKSLAEKEIVIASLKDEIDKYKQQQSSSSAELPNEDMSTSTISKAEEHSRMKDLDETFEEKYTKLRIFALKLKKKLNETVSQLKDSEDDKAKLEKILNDNEKALPTRSADEVDGCKVLDLSDLQAQVVSLTATVEASENVAAELEKVKVELDSKNQQLAAEIEAHKVTKENLEKARRDAKKKNVLSLEMEDYERSMKELTTKMEEKKKKMVQMESTIDTQESTITAMKTQIKLLEEQIRAEETQVRLTKEELQRAIEGGKEKDDVIQNKNAVILKLEQDLEDEKRKIEEADLEMTAVLGEKENLIMSLGDEKVELNNKVKRLEFKCAELNETLRITNIELADLKTEYTSYKVRAQAVLRQNQTVDHSQEEQLKEEAAVLRAQIEALNAKLTTAQEKCSELTNEVESSRRRAAEASGEAARAHQRTSRLQTDLTRLSHQLDSERAQHNLQVSTLTQCYKTQINELELKLQKETELLKNQLAAAQESAKAVGAQRLDEANHNQYMLPVIPKDEGSDGEMDINVSMIPREEGEGSESAPSPPPSKPYLSGASGRSPVPLERLLEEGVPDDEALDTTSLALTPEQEISDLRRRLLAQQQRVKHVTVLLSESERECARLSQLSELLKAELRRHGATHGAHNAEYMKNVTLKFLTLPPGDERSRLVPVLQKILTLTPDETHKIHAVAKGLDPSPSKGWGSYLPWPGGK